MASSVGIRDAEFNLLKLIAEKTNQAQAETVSQALIMYAASLGLIETEEQKIEVVKRTYTLKDKDWGDVRSSSRAA